MDDDALGSLLRSAAGPRRLDPAAAHRVRERLGLAPTPEAGPPIDTREGPHRRVTWLGVAAMLLLVVGLTVLVLRPDEEVIVSTDPAADAYTAVCQGELTAVTSGVTSWRGIDNWAFAGDAAPDLAALTLAALESFAAIGPDRPELLRLRHTFAEALATADDGLAPVRIAEAEARSALLRSALTDLLVLLDGQPAAAGCDLRALAESVG